MTGFRSTTAEVAKDDNILGGSNHHTDLSFAGTERCTILTLAEPSKRVTILKNDATDHTSEFEEWKKSAISNHTANL